MRIQHTILRVKCINKSSEKEFFEPGIPLISEMAPLLPSMIPKIRSSTETFEIVCAKPCGCVQKDDGNGVLADWFHGTKLESKISRDPIHFEYLPSEKKYCNN